MFTNQFPAFCRHEGVLSMATSPITAVQEMADMPMIYVPIKLL